MTQANTKLSKPFRIATEGATCDGRTISRQDIVDMAATYKPETYTARVNMEHIRGFSADAPFHAYGDVTAVSTQEVELDVGGKKEKRLALYGQVAALDNLVQLNARGQKLYPSVEINPNFASSGKAYLQGLAVTDSPASLGTEILAFAAGQGDKSPFASRKIAPGNLFSAVDDGVTLEFEDATPAQTEESKLFAGISAFFTKFVSAGDEKPADPPAPPPPPAPPANDNFSAAVATQMAAMATGMEKLSGTVAAIGTRLGTIETSFSDLKTKVEATDGDQLQRKPATGGRANYARSDF